MIKRSRIPVFESLSYALDCGMANAQFTTATASGVAAEFYPVEMLPQVSPVLPLIRSENMRKTKC